jgi:predicted anti-sigma-YlaC factor YlaD
VTPPATEPHPDDAAHRVVCQQVVELLSDYLDGVLGESLQADVDAHLTGCPECVLFLEQLQTTLALLGTLPTPDQLPGRTVDLLVRQFRELVS